MTTPLDSQAYPVQPTAPASSPAGYITPADLSGGSRPPLTPEQLEWRRNHFLEFMLQEVVRAIVGYFFPGLGPAFDQLVAWADDLRETLADVPILGDLVEAITGIEDGDLNDMGTFFLGIRNAIFGLDLSNPGAIIAKIAELIGTAIQNVINGLLNGNILVNAANIFGSLAANLFSFIPIGAIGLQPARTPLVAGTFPDADSISGNGIWSWDAAVSRTGGTGSAKVTADGTLKAMRGLPITVAQGQRFEPAIFVRWTDYVGSGSPVQLHVVKFHGDNEVGIQTLKNFTPPASSSLGLWVELAGSYLVEENVTSVRVRPVIAETATAGTFNFDDGGYRVKSNLMSNLSAWLGADSDDDLFGNPDEFEPTDLIPGPFRDWIAAVLDGLASPAPKEQPWTDLINSVLHALGHIPDVNVLGVGGPENIGGSVQSTWDQWISGLVGAVGSGAGLADLFNIGQDISGRATLGSFSWDILGIRSNKSLDTGFLPTSESPVSLSSLAFAATAPTFAVTQSASTIAWHRFNESGQFGAIGWQGSGNSSLTGFYVNIWKMDPATGDVELVHRSENILGDISPTLAAHVYEFTDAGVMRAPGDVFGAELTVVGAGTHNVVGSASWLPDQPVFPRRWAATRNSGTVTPPSTISSGSVTYSANVPFVEFALNAGSTPIPRQPQKVTFGYTGASETTVVPSWADFVDLIPFGAGAGGGGSLFGTTGVAGRNGECNPLTLAVGVDIKAGSVITVEIGAGGFAGGLASSGGAGGDTVITYIDPSDVVHTLTADGGTPTGGPGHVGWPAGDVTVAGELYRGGGSATFNGGAAPGGGGGGAFPWGAGFPGAPGGAWVTSRQA